MDTIKREKESLKLEIRSINQDIIYIKLIGRITNKVVDFMLDELSKYSKNKQVVLIDMIEFKSITPIALRNYLKKVNNIVVRVYFNIPFFYKNSFTKIISRLSNNILVKESYEDALKFGYEIIKSNSVIGKKILYDRDRFKFTISIISENILYLKLEGVANYNDVKFLSEKLKKEIDKFSKVVVIQDVTDFLNDTIKARIFYAQTFKDHPKIIAIVFFGASEFQKLKIKTINNLHILKFPSLIAKNYKDAIKEANLAIKNGKIDFNVEIDNYLDNKFLNIFFYKKNRKIIEGINRYLISIDWQNIKKEKEIFYGNKAFNLLFTSFTIMVSDIKDLIQTFKSKEKELLNAQKELEEIKQLLEKKVNERKIKLKEINRELKKEIIIKKENEKKVEMSKDIAQRDNRTKTIFLSNISDKLKISVEEIIYYTKSIGEIKSIDRAEIKENLEKLIKLSEQLSLNILDLITHSQIESGKISYNLKEYDFSKIIEESIKELDYLAEEKNIKVTFLDNSNGIMIILDKIKIKDVINNLLSNAIKFSPKNNEIIIEIKIVKTNIVFSIKDFGVGIAQNKLTSLFEGFTTNIGLIISKKIIKYHNGEIWVKNNRDKGVTFIFTLPLK